MEVDPNEEEQMKVLPWKISGEAAPKGMRVVRFDGDYLMILWFKTHAFVRKDVKADGSQKIYNSPKDLVKLDGVKIFDVFEVDGKVLVLDYNGDLSQLRRRSRNDGYSFKSLEKIRSGARKVLAIPGGFVTLLIISGHWYLNLYMVEDDGLELMQSLKLGSLPVEALNCRCVAWTCVGADLAPVLTEALFPNVAPRKKGSVVFVGFPTGQVFYFHLLTTTSCADITATMLYVSPEAVVGISMYQDPSTKKFSHIILVQRSGALVVMSGQDKVLKYNALYLPSSAHCLSLADTNAMWHGDGGAVWHTRAVRDDQGELVLRSSCIPVRDVDFLSCLEGQDEALALTNEKTLFYLRLVQSDNAGASLANYAATQRKIIKKSEELAEVLQEIARENLEIDVINYARRADLLRDKFQLTVRVLDAAPPTQEIQLGGPERRLPYNESGEYLLEGTLHNSSGQEIFSPAWSLQVSVTVGGVDKLQVTDLSSTFGRTPLRFKFPLKLADPCQKVSICCHLAAEVTVEPDSECPSQWVLLPAGSAMLDVSHFFKPMIASGHKIDSKYALCRAYRTQERLRNIADERNVGPEARLLMETPRSHLLTAQTEWHHLLRLPEGCQPAGVWAGVARRCLHRCEKRLRTRIKQADDPDSGLDQVSALDVLVGAKIVRLALDGQCTQLEIRCCDVALLHAVKDSIAALLRPADPVASVDTSLQRRVQEFKTEFELEQRETPNVVALRNKWREITAQLPI